MLRLSATKRAQKSHESLQRMHPIHAILGIGLLAVIASVLGRFIPFYRRELQFIGPARLAPLDGLRGILCFGVLYHHAVTTYYYFETGKWEQPPSAFYSLLGGTSVAFFFCVTGFLFWSRALASNGRIQAWSFLRGRWFRIVPLYAFTCLVALAVIFRDIDWSDISTTIGLIRMGLLGTRPWTKLGAIDVNLVNCGVTWTLQYEWAFYIALPALALLIPSGTSRRVMFAAAAMFVMLGIGHYIYFLIGMAAADIARRPTTSDALRRPVITMGVITLLVLFPTLASEALNLLAMILTALTFIPIACGNSLFGLLTWSGLRLMGTVSYSVYLLHGVFLYVGRPLLRGRMSSIDSWNLEYWLVVFALGCAVLVVCMITYRWIEWPWLQFEKQFRSRPKAPNAPGTSVSVPAITSTTRVSEPNLA